MWQPGLNETGKSDQDAVYRKRNDCEKGLGMKDSWEADISASLLRRLGKSPKELGNTDGRDGCPDIWLLDNGDIAVIGRNCTSAYRLRLPEGVIIGPGEDLVVIPGNVLQSAKPDIPDASE